LGWDGSRRADNWGMICGKERSTTLLTVAGRVNLSYTVMMGNDFENEMMGSFQDKPKMFLAMGSKSNYPG